MAGWVVEQRQPPVALPPYLKIAGVGSRIGAWLIDGILSGLLALVALAVAIASGGIGLNQAAIDQVQANPNLQPDVPVLVVRDGPLAAAAAFFVILNVIYYAGCWTMFRATPAQRLLSLQVADARTGRTIPFWRALVRWIAAYGLPTGVTALFLVIFAQTMATVSLSDMSSPYYSYTTTSAYTGPEGAASLLSWVGVIWSLVLLISTAASASKTGLHDRLAGTIVVGKAPVMRAWAPTPYWVPGATGPVPPQSYGQPPQSYGQPPYPPAPPISADPADPAAPALPTNPYWPQNPPANPPAAPTGDGSESRDAPPDARQ